MLIGDVIEGWTIEHVENSHVGDHSRQLLQLRDAAGWSWGYSIDSADPVTGFRARHEAHAAAQGEIVAILEVE